MSSHHVTRQDSRLLLDYDDMCLEQIIRLHVARAPKVAYVWSARVVGVLVEMRDPRHWHVTLQLHRRVDGREICAIQAILGSDWARELHNVMRCHAPACTLRQWNEYWATSDGGKYVVHRQASRQLKGIWEDAEKDVR